MNYCIENPNYASLTASWGGKSTPSYAHHRDEQRSGPKNDLPSNSASNVYVPAMKTSRGTGGSSYSPSTSYISSNGFWNGSMLIK